MDKVSRLRKQILSILLVVAMMVPQTLGGFAYALSEPEDIGDKPEAEIEEKADEAYSDDQAACMTEDATDEMEASSIEDSTEVQNNLLAAREDEPDNVKVFREKINKMTDPLGEHMIFMQTFHKTIQIPDNSEENSGMVYKFVTSQNVQAKTNQIKALKKEYKGFSDEEKKLLEDDYVKFVNMDIQWNILLAMGNLNAQRKIRVNHIGTEDNPYEYRIIIELLTKKGETTGVFLNKIKHEYDVIADKNSIVLGAPRTICVANGAAIRHIKNNIIPEVSDYIDYYVIDGEGVHSLNDVKSKISGGGLSAGAFRGNHSIAAKLKDEYGGGMLMYGARQNLNLTNEKKCVAEELNNEAFLKNLTPKYEEYKNTDTVKSALASAKKDVDKAESFEAIDKAIGSVLISVKQAEKEKLLADKKTEVKADYPKNVKYYEAFKNDKDIKEAVDKAIKAIDEAKDLEAVDKEAKAGIENIEKLIADKQKVNREKLYKTGKEAADKVVKEGSLKDYFSNTVVYDENDDATVTILEDAKLSKLVSSEGTCIMEGITAGAELGTMEELEVLYEGKTAFKITGILTDKPETPVINIDGMPETLKGLDGKTLTVIATGDRLGEPVECNVTMKYIDVDKNRKELIETGKQAADLVVREGSLAEYFLSTIKYDDEKNHCEVTVLKDAAIDSVASKNGTRIMEGLIKGLELGTMETLEVKYDGNTLFKLTDLLTSEPKTDDIEIDGLPKNLRELEGKDLKLIARGERLGKKPVTYTVSFKNENIKGNRKALIEAGKAAANKVVKEGSLDDYFLNKIVYDDEKNLAKVTILQDGKIVELASKDGTCIMEGLVAGVELGTMETLEVKYDGNTLFKLTDLLTAEPKTEDINIEGLPEMLKDMEGKKLSVIATGEKLGTTPVQYDAIFRYADIDENKAQLIATSKEGANAIVSEGSLKDYFNDEIVYSEDNKATVTIEKDGQTSDLVSMTGTKVMEGVEKVLNLGTMNKLTVKYDGNNILVLNNLLTSEPTTEEIGNAAAELPKELKDLDGKKLVFRAEGELLGDGVTYEVTFDYDLDGAKKKAIENASDVERYAEYNEETSVKKAAEEAFAAINNATTITDAEKAGIEGRKLIVNAVNLVKAKESAISGITKGIEDYDTYKDTDAVKLAVAEAKLAIMDGETPEEVKAKAEAGKEAINAVIKALKSGDYIVIEGMGATHIIGKDGELVFRADGEFNKFTGIHIDGKILDKKNYTAVKGSTVITLKKDYLDGLAEGKHKLTVNYTDGLAETVFYIASEESKPNGNGDKTDNEGKVKPSQDKSKKTDGQKKSAAKTGDADYMNIVILMAVAGLGVVTMMRRKQNK